ncbi:MAG: factor-independent urate hydroxylase, partial [Thermocrispum sp.]
MTIRLGENQYGKAETRLVRIDRDGDVHAITDLTVSTALAGDLADSHLTGDNAKVLPTDSQKNTVFAFAQEHGVGEIEEFGLRLARHFVASQEPIHRARVRIEQHFWDRIDVDGKPAPHSFRRSGAETRTAAVTVDGEQAWVVSGLKDLVVLNSTGSEFWGYPKDRYTTLPETHDRILATAVDARWRHATAASDWAGSYAQARRHLLEAFAQTHSRS